MAIFVRCEATYLIFKFKLIILQDQIYDDFAGNVMNDVHEIFKTMFNANRNSSQQLVTKISIDKNIGFFFYVMDTIMLYI